MGINVTGMHELSARLRRANTAASGLVSVVVRKVGADVMADSIASAPVDTGALRGSHTLTVESSATTTSAEVAPAVHYAHYVELGTSKMAPRPYLFPALRKHGPALGAAVSKIPGMAFRG